MMRAIVQERYGSRDVLELRDADQPMIGDDHRAKEVLMTHISTTTAAVGT
jgi:hypothetical protein